MTLECDLASWDKWTVAHPSNEDVSVFRSDKLRNAGICNPLGNVSVSFKTLYPGDKCCLLKVSFNQKLFPIKCFNLTELQEVLFSRNIVMKKREILRIRECQLSGFVVPL